MEGHAAKAELHPAGREEPLRFLGGDKSEADKRKDSEERNLEEQQRQ